MAYDIEGIVNPAEIVTLKSLNTEINESTAALIKFLELQAKYKTAADNVAGSNTSATQKINEYSKIINKASDEQNKLTTFAKEHQKIQQQLVATEAKIFASKSESNKQLIEEKLNLQKATKEIQLKVKAQQAEKGSIEQLSAVNAILEQRLRSVNLNTEEGAKKANLLRSAIDKNNVKIKENSSALSAQKINIGNYKSALEGLPGPIGNIANKADTLTTTLAKIGPVGALVAGAIVALSAPLIAFFTKSEKGVEMLERKTAGFKAAWNVLVGDMIRGGEKIADTFDKQAKQSTFWTRILSGISPGLIGLGIRMDVAADSAENFTQKQQDLEDQERALIVPRAEALKQIKAAMLLYNDESKSIEIRLKALQNAIDLENKTADAEIEHQKSVVENIKIINQEKKIAGQLRDEDDKKLQEAMAKEIDLSTESMGRQIRATARINAARKELMMPIEENAKKQKDIEKDAFDSIQKEREKSVLNGEKLIDEDLKNFLAASDAEMERVNKDFEDKKQIGELEVQAAIRDRQRQYEAERMLIESTAGNETEARRQIFELNKKYIDEDIALVKEQLNTAGLSVEQQIELSNQLKDLELENQLLVADDDKKKHDEKLARQKELADGLIQLGSKIFEFSIANTNAELSALEEKNRKGIISEESFNKKKAELEIKKAKQERNKALFEIAINTASAIVEALPNIALAAIAGVIGALSAATVLAEPLPKYWTGTKNAKEVGIVGDRGRELATLTTGENIMFDKPTLYAGKKFKGMHVRTNAETERIMSATEHTGFGAVSFSDAKLLEKLDRVEKAITNKPIGIFQDGKMVGYQQNNYRETYLNRLKHG